MYYRIRKLLGVTDKQVGVIPPGGDFPALIVYGMAGMAVIGGIIFFIISDRQLKKEKGQGQTGIAPSRLTGYQTSASAGGYQTNRRRGAAYRGRKLQGAPKCLQ